MIKERPLSIVPNTYVSTYSLGGTDAGAILGLNKFKTPLDVYNRLVNNVPEAEDSDIMERGRYLEPVCVHKYGQKYPDRLIVVYKEKFYHPDYPFLHASPDRGLIAKRSEGILEAKAPGDFVFDQYIENGFDQSYYCQLQHYFFVKDVQWGAFAMFAGGRWKLWDKDVERDEPFIERMESACITFWNENVLKKIPPPLPEPVFDFPRAALGGKTAYKPESEWVEAMTALKRAREDAKASESAKKQAEERVKELMGEITHATIPGVGKVSWNESTRHNFDVKQFRIEHPEIDLSPYEWSTAVRTFLPTFSK